MPPFHRAGPAWAAWLICAAGLSWPSPSPAAPPRANLPEPLIGESITDIDNAEAGEVELDVTGVLLGQTGKRILPWGTNVEVEWRANERLGLAAEIGLAGSRGLDAAGEVDLRDLLSLRIGASWAVWNDWKRDLFVQAQVSARLFATVWADHEFALGEPTLPYALRVSAAWRRGGFNLRATVGAAAGEDQAYTLLLDNVSFLYEWGRLIGKMHRAFIGLEIDADGTRRPPLALIPEAAVGVKVIGQVLRLGLACPLAPDLDGRRLLAGGLLRVTWEVDDD